MDDRKLYEVRTRLDEASYSKLRRLHRSTGIQQAVLQRIALNHLLRDPATVLAATVRAEMPG